MLEDFGPKRLGLVCITNEFSVNALVFSLGKKIPPNPGCLQKHKVYTCTMYHTTVPFSILGLFIFVIDCLMLVTFAL